MSNKTSKQAAFDASLFPPVEPAGEAPANDPAAPLPARRKRRAPAKPGAAVQAYLPGLSRRGRPRLPNAATAAERALASRKRRTEAGVKRIELFLDPAVNQALDQLVQHFNLSRTDVISHLIDKAAKRLNGKKTS